LGVYWPGKAKKEDRPPTLDEFKRAFSTLGFVDTAGPDFEIGRGKVVFYGKNGLVSHAARLISQNVWTNKCGRLARR
jgi:hypothetical protein